MFFVGAYIMCPFGRFSYSRLTAIFLVPSLLPFQAIKTQNNSDIKREMAAKTILFFNDVSVLE
jgi:hypothetical protein